MTLSLSTNMRLIRQKTPGTPISHDAALLLKIDLERRAESITFQASQIHDRENAMRQQIGERPKVRLSPRHVKMAIDRKFVGEQANDEH
jgi:hypothetical protein